MGLIEIASGNSVWRGMDYYNEKRVIFIREDQPAIMHLPMAGA